MSEIEAEELKSSETGVKADEIIEVKSESKLEIESEERVRGVEVEKKKRAIEEAALQSSRSRAPIGGIKIPGFLRSTKGKDKKDGETDGEEGTDLLEAQNVKQEDEAQSKPGRFPHFTSTLNSLKKHIPFPRKKEAKADEKDGDEFAEGEDSKKVKLLNAIKLPSLGSMLPKKSKQQNKEFDTTGVGAAGLASMETLDDSNGSKLDDNMENVKLDAVEYYMKVDPEKAALEDEEDTSCNIRDWRRHLKLIEEHKLIAGGLFLFVALLILVVVIAICGPRVQMETPVKDGNLITAVTSCGFVQGILENGAYVFRGIPYAVPPVGPLRWTTPKPLTLNDCWNGTKSVINSTAHCWQMLQNGSVDGSEDCLTLDVITPDVRYENPLPVVVLIGAETLLGGSPGRLVPSSELSWRKDVVFVRPNFRMNVFGFLAAAPLSKSTYPKSSGNYGLHDIVAALNWVQLNIEHFAGDSKQVTVVGYKAGATLVSALLSTHKIERLLTRVWLSSPSSVLPSVPLSEAEEQSESYLSELSSCKPMTIDCLREVEAEDLLTEIPDSWREYNSGLPKIRPGNNSRHEWLVIDGVLLRENPLDVWKRSNVTVDVVQGATKHCETGPAEISEKKSWNYTRIVNAIQNSVIGQAGLTSDVIKYYNATFPGLESIIADIRTICPMVEVHKTMSTSRFYVAQQVTDDGVLYDGADIDAILGAFRPTSLQQRRFVSAVQNMFYHYVAHGGPPKYKMTSIEQDPVLIKEVPMCDFWKANKFDEFARID